MCVPSFHFLPSVLCICLVYSCAPLSPINTLLLIYIYIYIGSKKHGVDSLIERVESISFNGKILNSRVLKCLI